MKALFISILFYLSSIGPDPIDRLQGRWKLEKIEIGNTTYLPQKKQYFMSVSRSTVTYNLDVNDCYSKIISINDTNISIESVGCTQVCCDGKDPIATYIDFNG
ncbi:MAG TPA: hypothetical protein VK705_07365, partial [Ferruginibacter sp.]|nr:hypothetical protein [Ferruginibacter sp.]